MKQNAYKRNWPLSIGISSPKPLDPRDVFELKWRYLFHPFPCLWLVFISVHREVWQKLAVERPWHFCCPGSWSSGIVLWRDGSVYVGVGLPTILNIGVFWHRRLSHVESNQQWEMLTLERQGVTTSRDFILIRLDRLILFAWLFLSVRFDNVICIWWFDIRHVFDYLIICLSLFQIWYDESWAVWEWHIFCVRVEPTGSWNVLERWTRNEGPDTQKILKRWGNERTKVIGNMWQTWPPDKLPNIGEHDIDIQNSSPESWVGIAYNGCWSMLITKILKYQKHDTPQQNQTKRISLYFMLEPVFFWMQMLPPFFGGQFFLLYVQ